MTKDELIELLLDNQATIVEVVNRVHSWKIEPNSPLFDDDYRKQFQTLVKQELINELSYNNLLTIAEFNDKIDDKELSKFIEEVLKYE